MAGARPGLYGAVSVRFLADMAISQSTVAWLRARWTDYCAGQITFAEFDASVQGWINHVRYADTWGLRGHALGRGLTVRLPE